MSKNKHQSHTASTPATGDTQPADAAPVVTNAETGIAAENAPANNGPAVTSDATAANQQGVTVTDFGQESHGPASVAPVASDGVIPPASVQPAAGTASFVSPAGASEIKEPQTGKVTIQRADGDTVEVGAAYAKHMIAVNKNAKIVE